MDFSFFYVIVFSVSRSSSSEKSAQLFIYCRSYETGTDAAALPRFHTLLISACNYFLLIRVFFCLFFFFTIFNTFFTIQQSIKTNLTCLCCALKQKLLPSHRGKSPRRNEIKHITAQVNYSICSMVETRFTSTDLRKNLVLVLFFFFFATAVSRGIVFC